MSYFSKNYTRINLPIADSDGVKGLRNAQIGAIHAIGSHFTINKDTPAIVTMPTGSGKTAVLVLSCYLLRAKRVLVLSSSVLVRGQIFNEFNKLSTLKYCNVFHKDIKSPKVKEIKNSIKSKADWEEYKGYDVVIGIPKSINSGIALQLPPSEDLFDLILVDEAHHIPAFTWTNIVEYFKSSKKIFFTATPFRRDKREIPGRNTFSYPLTLAYEDKIFGDIGYHAVTVGDDGNQDLAIALKANEIFQIDRASNYNHFLMVRTDSKAHAKILDKIYKENTDLKLRRIDSTKTYTYISQTIKKLRSGELDGIICVDMLGEGFDFPNLKIAAIHKPHKSLSVTLQFIGRFARTNAENIGDAKFIAIPNDITIGKKQLFKEGAIWNDIIKDLSENAIEEEDNIKEVLDTFEIQSAPGEDDQFSFYNLNPYLHVKVYHVGQFNLEGVINVPGHEVVYEGKSEENSTIIYITKETNRPKWVNSDQIVNVEYYLFVIYFDESNNLLFIHSSSIRAQSFYDELAEEFSYGDFEPVAKKEINRVLIDLEETEFFNIGMQNRSPNSGESYRTISGPNAEKTIRKSHGRLYANGHVFGKAKSGGEALTIGYSSGAKVWSNAYKKIPQLIDWCSKLGAKIKTNKRVETKTGLDNLSIGERVEKFPQKVVLAAWNADTFNDDPFLYVMDKEEVIATFQLLDFGIIIHKDESTDETLICTLSNEELEITLSYDFKDFYKIINGPENEIKVGFGKYNEILEDYLGEYPMQLYLSEFGNIINHDYHKSAEMDELYFNKERIESINWTELGTDVTIEFYETEGQKIDNGNRDSIHETLGIIIKERNPDVLIYDHGTGEVADYISINEDQNEIFVELFHVKKSGGDSPGDRVNDIYEVCMQAIKSQLWTNNKKGFIQKISNRVKGKPEKFVNGTQNEFVSIMGKTKKVSFKFSIVQPGISQETLSGKLSTIIAACDDSIQNNGYGPIGVLGSLVEKN